MLNLATQNYCNSRHNRHTEKHHFRHQFQANRPTAQKRLMIAAMAVAAGAAFAETAPITSANVVGFNTNANEAEELQTFIGASFFTVGGDESLPLSALQCVEGFEDGDQIQTSFLHDDGMIDFVTYDYDSFEGGWCLEGELVDDSVVLELGQGAWLVTPNGAKHSLTSGQVKSDNKVRTLTEAQQVVCSLYPVAFCPNGENVDWNVEDGAQIQTAFIHEDGLIDFITYDWDSFEGGWCFEGELLDPDFAIVQAGVGFWLVLGDNFADCDFSETSPLYVNPEQ